MTRIIILARMRGFAFHPVKEFATVKEGTIKDAFKYYCILLAGLAAILAVFVALAVVAASSMIDFLDISKLAPLPAAGVFVGIFAAGLLVALYIPVWLHIWVYVMGGRKGLKQTEKAVMYGATPCLMLGWLPGANIVIGPIWSLIVIINGVMELHKMSPGKAMIALILAILVPLIAVGAIAAILAATLDPATLLSG